MKRESSLKVLGVMTDKNLTLKTHFKFFENKISKRGGIFYLKKVDFKIKISVKRFHPYINYSNIICATTKKSI